MITIKPSCNKLLSCTIDNVKSIAYDGCDYALLVHRNEAIIRLDEHGCVIDSYRCNRIYACICFDTKQCCYIVCLQDRPSTFYRLDLNFNVTHKFEVDPCREQPPCAISAHPLFPILVLLYPDEIVFWDESCEKIINKICIRQDIDVLDIIALEKGYAISYQKDAKTYIEICCSPCQESKVYVLENTFEYLAMILVDVCLGKNESHYEIQLLVNHCDSEATTSILLDVACIYQEPAPKPCPIPQPENLTCEGGKNEIIHSIALEEAGIAHILNAEGEKLQKAVASDISIEELLMVNESVRKTITQITLLEGQLYSKLESLHCLCFDDSENSK